MDNRDDNIDIRGEDYEVVWGFDAVTYLLHDLSTLFEDRTERINIYDTDRVC